jgi:mono/diheme cytochrome c family protein
MRLTMRSSFRVSIAVLASVIVSAAVAQSNSATADPGRQLFESFQCWQCHGYEGQGGVGPRIAATVYPFEAFSRLVRHTTLMPAYSPNVLTDDELRTIWEFVRSQPEPPAAEDIPEMGAR